MSSGYTPAAGRQAPLEPPVRKRVCPVTGDRHAYEWMGRAGKLGQGHKCSDPIWLLCMCCGADLVMPCKTSDVRKCRHCGLAYKRSVQRRIREGIVMVPAESVACLTWTAPGVKRQCRKHRACQALGLECEPYATLETEEEVAAWHADLTKRRNRLLTAIRRGEASPLVNGRLQPIEDLEYFSAREVQDGKRRGDGQGRGVLHGHDVLKRSGGAPLVLSERKLRKLLLAHGFGRKFTLKAITGNGAASYLTKCLAKYVSKSVCDRQEVVSLSIEGELVKWRGRLWTSSRAWSGCKSARAAVRLAAGEPLVSSLAELCDVVLPEGLGEALALLEAAFPGGELVGAT